MAHNSIVTTFYVEGPNWKETVSLDADIFPTEDERILEAATIAIETSSKRSNSKFQLGPMVQVKEKTGQERTALVNAYKCLLNAGKHDLAKRLHTNFQKNEGQDLGLDDKGYSWI